MTPEKLAYLKEVERLRRSSVEGVVGQSNSSNDVLTDKQRARVQEVRAILDRGDNPFENISALTIGGGEKIQVEREMSPQRIAALEKKWGERPKVFEVVEVDDPDLTPFPTKQVGLFCSFCKSPVEEVNATRGTGPLVVKYSNTIEAHTDNQGETTIIEKNTMKATSPKIVACPNCVLNVTIGAARFPYTEG
jgi:hypothetical protein